MKNTDIVHVLERSIEEISSLRRQIDALSPKAEAYDSIRTILDLMPGRSQGYGEDVVWLLRRQIEELQPKVSEE